MFADKSPGDPGLFLLLVRADDPLPTGLQITGLKL